MPEGKGYKPQSNESKRQAFIRKTKKELDPPKKAKPKGSKLHRKIKELIGGKNTYLPKKSKAKTAGKIVPKSQRDVLRRNLTKKEIERFK